MIILSVTTDKIQAVLNAAKTTNDMQVMVSYRETTTTTYTPGRQVSVTNGTSAVDILGSPAASTFRTVDFISVYNADTTIKTLTIRFNHAGGDTILWIGTLAAGERVEYTDKGGWNSYTVNGLFKISQVTGTLSPVSTTFNIVVLGSDVINNNATLNTLADVTGLAFNVTAGKTYYFEVFIDYTSAATATGSRWTITGPAATRLSYTSEYSLTTTTKTLNNLVAYQLPAASNATSAATTGNCAIIWGHVTPGGNGAIQVQFASEVASSAITAKAGSILRWIEVL